MKTKDTLSYNGNEMKPGEDEITISKRRVKNIVVKKKTKKGVVAKKAIANALPNYGERVGIVRLKRAHAAKKKSK